MIEKVIDRLNNSCFAELLNVDSITDISYNGEKIYYLDNFKGRQLYDKKIEYDEIRNLIKDITNFLDINFSISNPIVDVSFLNIRLNVVHESISKKYGNKRLIFSIRKFSKEIRITNNNDFFDEKLFEFFKFILKNKLSIIIYGEPSSGKTEFQKYLLKMFENNERLVIIDTINELDLDYKNSDVSIMIPEKSRFCNVNNLIKTSLRLNPDYLILAEARGDEFLDVYNSLLTGISTITTMHAKTGLSLISRIKFLLQKNDINMNIFEQDIYENINVLIGVKKEFTNGRVKRYINEILISDGKDYKKIYKEEKGVRKFYKLPEAYSAFKGFQLQVN